MSIISLIYKTPKDYSKQIRTFIDKTIYYEYFCDTTHPLVNKSGKVYLHRHLASLMIGRWLQSNEHVHHINGNKLDNSLSNLQIITAEEHATLHQIERGFKATQVISCPTCNITFKQVYSEQIYCSNKCINKEKKKLNIPVELLEKLVWTLPTTKVAQLLDMTDVAVGKKCRKLGISKPPRGYWTKYKNNIPV